MMMGEGDVNPFGSSLSGNFKVGVPTAIVGLAKIWILRVCRIYQNIVVEVSNRVLNVWNRFRTLELLGFELLGIS